MAGKASSFVNGGTVNVFVQTTTSPMKDLAQANEKKEKTVTEFEYGHD